MRQTVINFGDLLGDMQVNWLRAVAACNEHFAHGGLRYRAQTVKGDSDFQARSAQAVQTLQQGQISFSRVEKPHLARRQRAHIKSTDLIQRRQQDQSNANFLCRINQGQRHFSGVGVSGSISGVMQVMKLADTAVSDLQHLHVELCGHITQCVGVKPRCHGVHALTPGPETVSARTTAFRQSAHRALKGMRMGIGDAGQSPIPILRQTRRHRLPAGGCPAAGLSGLVHAHDSGLQSQQRRIAPAADRLRAYIVRIGLMASAAGVIRNARVCTLVGAGIQVINDATVAWRNGLIDFVGADADFHALPVADDDAEVADSDVTGAGATDVEVINANGALLTPGLIDCHTHLVYGGQRSNEFEARLAGASYAEIARSGGGIKATVRATRGLDDQQLLAQSLPRARALLADGVTTIEIKSGYGLDLESESRMLRTARQIGETLGISVRTTALCAHAVPEEYAGNADGYVDLVCAHMLPALAEMGLVDAVDAFCEGIGFTPAQTRRVFETAKALGLPVKLHADQLSDLGGAQLVAEFAGLSADHVEYTSSAGIHALAQSGGVAVLLPGAFYSLRETRPPPVAQFRSAGVPMAVATDLNPGTSPLASLRVAMNMACVLFGLTVDEALRGATINAAKALGLMDRGQIRVGAVADLALWPVASPAELVNWIGGPPPLRVIAGGITLFRGPASA